MAVATIDGVDFDVPFGGIFSGGLDWSLHGLVEQHRDYQEWVDECFSDPEEPYDAIWHDTLGFAHAPNGDCIAVDLTPGRVGEVVYLSHDDGEGHGYVLAQSLDDLLDRWVPLACPGPEDWQWLSFVPFDFGPIDPAGENGLAWRQLLGLSAAPPRTPPSVADDALFDELVARSRASVDGWAAHRLAARALSVCSSDRAESVIGLLDDDGPLQGEAARTLGRWRPAVDALKRVALSGSIHGRRSAIIALRAIPCAESRDAIDDLRGRLSQDWQPYLDLTAGHRHQRADHLMVREPAGATRVDQEPLDRRHADPRMSPFASRTKPRSASARTRAITCARSRVAGGLTRHSDSVSDIIRYQ